MLYYVAYRLVVRILFSTQLEFAMPIRDYETRVNDLEALIDELKVTIGQLGLSSTIKTALMHQINDMQHKVNELKGSIGVVDNSIREPIAHKPEVHLVEFSLYPHSKEMVMDGMRKKLPPKEFQVMYDLAINVNGPVTFNSDHSLLTRMSKLRREFPKLKKMIESLGKGSFVLHGKRKA